MGIYYLYLRAYLLCLILFLISIVWFYFHYFYAAVFFASTLGLLLQKHVDRSNSFRSSIQHYENYASVQPINFILFIFLVVTAFLYGLLPIHPALTILFSWSILAYIIRRYFPAMVFDTQRDLISSYLYEQFPFIDKSKLDTLAEGALLNPDKLPTKTELNLEEKDYLDIKKKLTLYLENNSQ